MALFGALISGFATFGAAQDSGALLNVLVRKGILSDQEAEDIRAELTAESHAAVMASVSGGKSTNSLSISGRLQVQYAGLDSDAAGLDPTNHLFLRRVYFGAKANVGANWSANLNYDFAAASFDKAYIEYTGLLGDQAFAVDVGLRKVNFGMEESTSSGSLDAIERSGVTRYFVESNNGRRLGAGSYRNGVFFEGNPLARSQKSTGVFYGVAVTDPERPESGTAAAAAGDAITNTVAYWADLGYSGVFGAENQNKYRFGVGAARLGDQGGKMTAEGSDITAFDLYGNILIGQVKLAGEFLSATVEDALGVGQDASPWGVWIQPSYAFNEKFELVARYSYTDSDNRGIKVSDGVRSAPGSFTGDNLTELYLGLNYYFVGPDLKLQLGFVKGTAERNGKKESADGVRSQLQVNF